MARVLLDESLPRQLAPILVGHEVLTVHQVGWTGITNGALLRQAAERFDVFATGDQSIQHQQDLSSFEIGLVIVAARNNRVETICSMAPQITTAINAVRPGKVQVVAA